MTEHESNFQQVYDVFHPRILRYLSRFVDETDAEDLSQEVFARISRTLTTFRGESQLSTWIYRIATNAALDKLRKHSVGTFVWIEGLNQSREPSGRDKDALKRAATPSTEQRYLREEMNECIRRFVDKLPENYRVVVVLSEFEGFKDNEIAEILGVSPGAVKIRLHRARAGLKEALEAHCSFYQDERGELGCDVKSAYRERRTRT